LAATFIKEKLGLKKLAVLHDKGDYGKGFAELVKSSAEAMGIEVALLRA
jgi:branched-chain amino acid transport system substrate-binding protein